MVESGSYSPDAVKSNAIAAAKKMNLTPLHGGVNEFF